MTRYGSTLEVNRDPPLRIVSLLPAATEWICALGYGGHLVGVSHECNYPESVQSLPRVTSSRIPDGLESKKIDDLVREHCEAQTPLYDLDVDKIAELRPDFMVTQTLCKVCAVSSLDVNQVVESIGTGVQIIEFCSRTFVEVIEDAKQMIARFGDDESSRAALDHLQHRITDVRHRSAQWKRRPRMTLLEWVQPLFCGGHWTPQLIEWAGGNDGLGRCGAASRLVQPEELFAMDPEILLIACCGLDADRGSRDAESLQKIPGWHDLSCVRDGQLFIFDGSAWFNRSGPRLVDALEAVSRLVTKWQGR